MLKLHSNTSMFSYGFCKGSFFLKICFHLNLGFTLSFYLYILWDLELKVHDFPMVIVAALC